MSLCCALTCFGQIPERISSPLEAATDQWLIDIARDGIVGTLNETNCTEFKNDPDADELSEMEKSLLDEHCMTLLEVKALSDLYFPLFEKKLESLGLPNEYKYLPVVLSGLNAHYEGSFDRAGLWQLSFAVSKRFGLTVTPEIDERKAADLSTDAALAQLMFLNEKYDGNQQLVTLAFIRSPMYANKLLDRCGEGVTLTDCLEPLDAAWFEYLDFVEKLFSETQGSNALFEFIKKLNEYENMAFAEDVSYDALATVLKVDKHTLQQANPTFHSEKIPADYRNVVFIMPKAQAEAFPALADSIYSFEDQRVSEALEKKEKEAEKIAKGIPDMTNREQKTYKVRSGDVLGAIAQRFGVRVSDLKAWNDIRGDMIYVGQTLVLYPKKGAETKQPKSTTTKTTTEKSTSTPTPTPSGTFENYTVKPGESLWLIAKKFPGVSAENIMEWNQIEADIRPGQVLKIYK